MTHGEAHPRWRAGIIGTARSENAKEGNTTSPAEHRGPLLLMPRILLPLRHASVRAPLSDNTQNCGTGYRVPNGASALQFSGFERQTAALACIHLPARNTTTGIDSAFPKP